MTDGEIDVERTLGAIKFLESEIRNAHGDDLGVTPWDFRLPTGSELRSMRKVCGLSQLEVADITGYSQGTINATEESQQAPGRQQIQTLLRLYRREWPQQRRRRDA